MNIQNITQTENGYTATFDGVEMSVPVSEGNRHYRAIMEAIAAGAPVVDGTIPTDAEIKAQIKAERDRRLALGFTFNGKRFQFTDESKGDISGSSASAIAAIMANPAAATDPKWHGGVDNFKWICADNTYMEMDAQTMIAFGNAAMAHRAGHIFAADTLRNMDPIPADFTNDAYWPVV